jgi:hypothetical protein
LEISGCDTRALPLAKLLSPRLTTSSTSLPRLFFFLLEMQGAPEMLFSHSCFTRAAHSSQHACSLLPVFLLLISSGARQLHAAVLSHPPSIEIKLWPPFFLLNHARTKAAASSNTPAALNPPAEPTTSTVSEFCLPQEPAAWRNPFSNK